MSFAPEKLHADLGFDFFSAVQPHDFGELKVRYFNQRAAKTVGLQGLSETEIKTRFGRFAPFDGSLPEPLALKYHGHQFQTYNPDIGDGRGFLYAQMREQQGMKRLLDFGTKGSGRTPFSRSGDGRLTLKGAVREVLATTMLAAQGVPTSRTFAIVEDLDAKLHRGDEPSPARGAIMTRLNHSHIRFGTFQRQAYEQRPDNIEKLVRYCLRTYFRVADADTLSVDDAVRLFYGEVIRRKALTVGAWMMAGFVHGVLNTDNMNITGESFDYGPWRWNPTYNGNFTAAYFDHQGLYAYGRQPQAVAWNLQVLGSVLATIHQETQPLTDLLHGYSDHLQTNTIRQFFWRMGLTPSGHMDQDTALAEACLKQLQAEQSPFELLFYAARSGQLDRLSPEMNAILQPWSHALNPIEHSMETLLIEEVEALWAPIAEQDDWQPLNDKIKRLEMVHDTLQADQAPAILEMEKDIHP